MISHQREKTVDQLVGAAEIGALLVIDAPLKPADRLQKLRRIGIFHGAVSEENVDQIRGLLIVLDADIPLLDARQDLPDELGKEPLQVYGFAADILIAVAVEAVVEHAVDECRIDVSHLQLGIFIHFVWKRISPVKARGDLDRLDLFPVHLRQKQIERLSSQCDIRHTDRRKRRDHAAGHRRVIEGKHHDVLSRYQSSFLHLFVKAHGHGVIDAEDRLHIGISVEERFGRITGIDRHIRGFVVFRCELDAVLCQEPDIDLSSLFGVTAVRTSAEHAEPGKAMHIDEAVDRFFDAGLIVIVYGDIIDDIRCGKYDRDMFELGTKAAHDPLGIDVLHTAEADDQAIEFAAFFELIDRVIDLEETVMALILILRAIKTSGNDDQVQILVLADAALHILDELLTKVREVILQDQSDRSFSLIAFNHGDLRPFPVSSSVVHLNR